MLAAVACSSCEIVFGKVNEHRRTHLRTVGPSLGLATVEVALTLPILILIALATIDTCRVIFVRQSAKIAAYECARIAIVPGVTYRDVKMQCDAMMVNRKINNFELFMSRDPELLIKGDLLSVTVAVPADSNSLGISWFYRGRVFAETVAILVEQSSS